MYMANSVTLDSLKQTSGFKPIRNQIHYSSRILIAEQQCPPHPEN